MVNQSPCWLAVVRSASEHTNCLYNRHDFWWSKIVIVVKVMTLNLDATRWNDDYSDVHVVRNAESSYGEGIRCIMANIESVRNKSSSSLDSLGKRMWISFCLSYCGNREPPSLPRREFCCCPSIPVGWKFFLSHISPLFQTPPACPSARIV